MNITLYPLGAYVSGYCLPFTIELDGLDQAGYSQAVSAGLYAATYKKGDGNVLSSRCLRCDTVVIASVEKECACCGNLYMEVKQTDEEWIVCDYEEVPAQFVGEYDLSSDFFAYSEFMATTNLEPAVIDAGLACGLDLLQIEDAYQGLYDSNTSFAEQYAENTGALNESSVWPYTCIDWDWAARELMHDYSEQDQHYFYIS
ncbi:antirestriction protein ArdA [Methylobacter psychrophilus]|uniref:antirestriction protein ArdA n=1 Tax=Methylobacter psychrophilus TaxID=96941 RepID=UPI0021D50655|nr:antirestriction protein ArdA [Methylobacter psychrophilus]